MPISISEKKVRGKYHVEAVNAFVSIYVLEIEDGTFTTQMKFKKRSNVFLTVTLTHSQLMDYLKEGIKDTTFNAPGAMYGVSDESVIHLFNMDLQVTKAEMKSYIEMNQSLQKVLGQLGIIKSQLAS